MPLADRFMDENPDAASAGSAAAAPASSDPDPIDDATKHAMARGDFLPDAAPAAAAPAPAAAAPAPASATPATEPGAAAAGDPPAAATPPADDKASIMVPKSRLDEVLAQVRELKEQVAKGQPAQPAQPATPPQPQADPVAELNAQLNTLQGQYESALLDGDTKLAGELRAQMATVDQHRMAALTNNAATIATTRMQAQAAYEGVVNAAVTDYPMLFPTSGEGVYQPELEREALELRDAYLQMGHPAHVALAKAVDVTMRANGVEKVGTVKAPPAEPAKTPEQLAAEKVAAAEAKAAERKTAAVERNVAAIKATPPDLSGVGVNSDAHGANSKGIPDVSQMSEAEFEALRKDPAKMALARGDLTA